MGDTKFSIPKLNGTNWQTWNVRVENLLARDDLWYVIDEPVFDEEDRSEDWKRDNRKAKATIILLLEDSQLPLIKNCVLARDVYDALKRYHQKTTRSIRVSLLKKLCAFNLAEDGDMDAHLREFDDLFDRLDGAGTTLDRDTKICLLLRSLPPSYDGLVTAMDSRSDDDISLDVVKSKLVDEYNRQLERRGGEFARNEKAMRSTEARLDADSRICHYCKNPGHIKRNCRKYLATLKKEADSSCTSCSECGKAKVAQSDSRSVAFAVGGGKCGSWVIDSGACAHMCSDRSFFTSLKKSSGDYIVLADGKNIQCQGEGNGVVYGIDGSGEVMKITMNNVKYVPGLSANLISVDQLAKKNYKVLFAGKGCDIVGVDGAVVATGHQHGGLYYLNMIQPPAASGYRYEPKDQVDLRTRNAARIAENHVQEEESVVVVRTTSDSASRNESFQEDVMWYDATDEPVVNRYPLGGRKDSFDDCKPIFSNPLPTNQAEAGIGNRLLNLVKLAGLRKLLGHDGSPPDKESSH